MLYLLKERETEGGRERGGEREETVERESEKGGRKKQKAKVEGP